MTRIDPMEPNRQTFKPLACRSKEVPPRPMLVWGMDVSKQLVSSGMAHILGMVIAMVAQLQATKQVTSECSWYFVVFSVDTTLGIMLVITMHNSCVRMAKQQLHKDCSGMSEWSSSDDEEMADDMEQQLTSQRHRTSRRVDWPWVYESIADCGSYGTPPSVAKWAIQVCPGPHDTHVPAALLTSSQSVIFTIRDPPPFAGSLLPNMMPWTGK